MTEELYEELWFFVKKHKEEIVKAKDETPEIAAWNLYLSEGNRPIPHSTPSEYRVIQRCILDALV